MAVTAVTELPIEPDHIRRPDTFNTDVANFLAALNTFRTELNSLGVDVFNLAVAMTLNATTSTSTTSLTVGTGTQNLTVETGKSYVPGQSVIIANTTTPTNYMAGVITSYTSGTGALDVNVLGKNGSGTYTAWTITLSAPIGACLAANTFTSKQEMPSIKITTGAALNALLLSDADGDGAWTGLYNYSARTSNTELGLADYGKFIDITANTFSQTFAAVATLGANWWCFLRNSGTGTITLDPNGSETIDGVTTGYLKSGMTLLIVCTGSAFQCVRIGPYSTVELLTSGTEWVCPIGVRTARIRGVGGGASGATGPTDSVYGGNGAGAGYFEAIIKPTPGTTYTYTIGAGGAHVTGTSQNGNAGGDTTFTIGGVTMTGNGGPATTTSPLAGGSATNGDINIPGGPSNPSSFTGGSSMLGWGSVRFGSSGLVPTGYGSGGYGWVNTGYSQAGKDGCIILEY